FGYLALSFSIPSFSQFEKEERLGYSTIAGIALVLLALVLDAIAFGFENALRAKGFFPIWLLVLAAAVILSTNAYSIILKKPLVLGQRQVVSASAVDDIKKQIELIAQKESEEQKQALARKALSGGAPPWVVRDELAKKQEGKLLPPAKFSGGKAIIDSIAQNAGGEGIEQPLIENDSGKTQEPSPANAQLRGKERQPSAQPLSTKETAPSASSNKEKQIKLVEQKELEEESSSNGVN
ncbi:hypothetical protein HY993_04640, partial [Candidatus Micrarchaeota archaeon]|nr:hypothetical protein [Candidatus Micrarchaeota archaeon]